MIGRLTSSAASNGVARIRDLRQPRRVNAAGGGQCCPAGSDRGQPGRFALFITALPRDRAGALKSRLESADALGMDRLARMRRQTAAQVATAARHWLAERTRIFRGLGDRDDFDEWAGSVTEAIEDRRLRAESARASASATDTDAGGDRLHGSGGVEATRDRDPLRPRLNEGGS
jgi:hypothetical protein